MSNEKLLQYIYVAAREYKKLIGKSFLFIGKNRNTDYKWFECTFEKKNFMHLLGIKSQTYTADEFFDVCDMHNDGLEVEITIEDCTPSRNHGRITVNEKVSVCPEILQIHNAKYLKIGDKDKISQYVDFSYVYGSDAVLGFHKDGSGSSYPVTLIPKNINNFATKSYRVIFVFRKNKQEKKYVDLYVKIKNGLVEELYFDFPERLKNRIDADFIKNKR